MFLQRLLIPAFYFSSAAFVVSALYTVAPAQHWALIAAVFAALLLLLNRRQLAQQWDRTQTLALLGLAAWPLYQLISLLCWHGPWDLAAEDGYYGIAILLALALRQHRPPAHWVFAILAIGSLATGWEAMRQVYHEAQPRAHGHWMAIDYGDWSLLLGLSTLFGTQLKHLRWPWRWFFLLGAVAGTAASVLSGSRGGWLAILIYGGAHAWHWWWHGRSRRTLIGALLLTGLTVILASSHISSRMAEARDDLGQFAHGQKETSLGMRFVMWRIASQLTASHPLQGIGPGRFQQALIERVQHGELPDIYTQFQHPHNDVLDALVSGGVVKLALVLAIIGLWLYLFSARSGMPSGPFRIAGCCLVLGIILGGLTEALLRDPLTARMWPMSLALFWAMGTQALPRKNP